MTLNLYAPLRRARSQHPHAEAAVCGDQRLTFAEVDVRVRRLADGLLRRGLRPGDRVGVLAANCHRVLELYQAVPAAGLVLVPLNSRYAVPELREVLSDSGCSILLADRDLSELADLVQVVDLESGCEGIVDAGSPVPPGEGVEEDDVAVIYYTGGTTGRAKGVMLTHRNLLANAQHLIGVSDLGPDDRWLVMAPPFHVSGTFGVLACTWVGATQVLQPAFTPSAALDAIADERITITLGVPTMLAALATAQQAQPRDLPSLRYLSHAGAPIAVATVRAVHDSFPQAELAHFYGATETAPLATAVRHEELLLGTPRERSCGQAVVGVEVAIADAEGRHVRAGEVGEVLVRGPNVMAGYWQDQAATRAAFIGDAYRTGDLGHLDDSGFLYLVDRAKDMIVSGGENVYSTEVENALFAHPAVAEAAVFGIPDERWGEAVHAVVVPTGTVTVEELLAFCRDRIAGYKVPKSLDLWDVGDPLPKTGAGKVQKHVLRQAHWEGQELAIHG